MRVLGGSGVGLSAASVRRVCHFLPADACLLQGPTRRAAPRGKARTLRALWGLLPSCLSGTTHYTVRIDDLFGTLQSCVHSVFSGTAGEDLVCEQTQLGEARGVQAPVRPAAVWGARGGSSALPPLKSLPHCDSWQKLFKIFFLFCLKMFFLESPAIPSQKSYFVFPVDSIAQEDGCLRRQMENAVVSLLEEGNAFSLPVAGLCGPLGIC